MGEKECANCGSAIKSNSKHTYENPYYKKQHFCSKSCKDQWIFDLQKGNIDKRTIVKKIGRPAAEKKERKMPRVKDKRILNKINGGNGRDKKERDTSKIQEKRFVEKIKHYERIAKKTKRLKSVIKALGTIKIEFKDILEKGDGKILDSAESLLKHIIYGGN
jgi:hypothetical protein